MWKAALLCLPSKTWDMYAKSKVVQIQFVWKEGRRRFIRQVFFFFCKNWIMSIKSISPHHIPEQRRTVLRSLCSGHGHWKGRGNDTLYSQACTIAVHKLLPYWMEPACARIPVPTFWKSNPKEWGSHKKKVSVPEWGFWTALSGMVRDSWILFSKLPSGCIFYVAEWLWSNTWASSWWVLLAKS